MIKTTSLYRILIGIAVFVFTYIIIYSFNQYFSHLMALSINTSEGVTFNKVDFIQIHRSWSKLRIIQVFGFAPLILISIGLYTLYKSRVVNTPYAYKYVLLWMFFGTFNFFGAQVYLSFLGNIDIMPELYQGFANIFAWLKFPSPIMAIMAISFGVFSIILGFLSASKFKAFFIPDYKGDYLYIQPSYYISIYFLPIIFGSGIIYLLSTGYSLPIHIVFVLSYFIFGSGILLKRSMKPLDFHRTKPNTFKRFNPLFIVFVAVLVGIIYFFWRV